MICKNCGQNFEGNFCNNCGQNSNVRKIDFKYLVDEISNSILQVDFGIFFTVKELIIKPGHSIREFLLGKRKQHFKPLAFILLVSAIYVLITYFTGKKTFLGEILSEIIREFNDNKIATTITAKTLNWLSNNFGYTTLIFLPFFSFASYITYRKSKYNFFEHLILNFYIAGQQIIIYSTFTVFFYVFNIKVYFIQKVPLIIATLYTFWAFNQFFEKEKIVLKILLTTATYILYIILLHLLFGSLGFIEGIINSYTTHNIV